MSKLNCQIFDSMGDTELKKYLHSKLKSCKIRVISNELSLKTIDSKAEVLGVFVDSEVDKKVLDKMPKLKLIATMSTGYDHIDLEECKKRNITVCNVPNYGENTVAEHTMALILSLSRKIYPSIKRVKEGHYDFVGLRGFDLKGKAIGIVGTGSIGIHLITMLKCFETKVIAYDVKPNKATAKKYGFTYVSFDKLLSRSDIISFHVPLFPSTHHMINKKNIKKIKKGAYLINTARGGLIEAEALAKGLKSGQIAGAGLDVLEEEELLQNPKKILYTEKKDRDGLLKTNQMNKFIVDHPNTIITPHNAFNSTEALKRIIDITAENIIAYSKGRVQNIVN
ncbi:hydroxyacid dehydrogenase [Patescibacteria group bacterium]|nr:hydroxyacid dehydrogenase [Patescibacteria group bacterium]